MKLGKTEYNTIHQWMLRNYKKTGFCETCKSQVKTEWSTKTGTYDRFNRLEWQELCKKCHYKYDFSVLGRTQFGRESGRIGGKARNPKKGFGSNRELARTAGRLGGLNSRKK